MPIKKYPVDRISEYIRDTEIFITCLSYEKRCLAILKHLDADRLEKVIVVENESFVEHNAANKKAFSELFEDKIEFVKTSTKSPVQTADSIHNSLSEVGNSSNILIDITTFTHESLLITLKLLEFTLAKDNLIKFVYSSAASYGSGEMKDIWLSKGVSEIRSVLGYSGDFLPSQKTHLIILVGYEYERASKLIEVFEPNLISLGCGKPGTETAPKHNLANKYFHELVKQTVNVYSDVDDFVFSCSNPWETKKAILAQVSKYTGYNPVVAPMNTKLSTIGCALAVKENCSIQICYAQANLYNIKNYSTPGENCYLFELPELRQDINSG